MPQTFFIKKPFVAGVWCVPEPIYCHFELQGASYLVLKTILIEVRNALGSSGLERIGLELRGPEGSKCIWLGLEPIGLEPCGPEPSKCIWLERAGADGLRAWWS